ncbi:2-keto-4-pentenoate hydratase [Streptomyces spongiae]|uniref:2-keto-4-pentenoate hydratase n=1 Tax=Streptomyces spongiae TaxID=565072 RepID=A0A5N8X9A7_9ACTN|nr:fumarylacetoacetate hydrolase family protein [Streptomyces spongiae]MPY55957.1 2-keto-4-pentenoate hydratase [Streptomyces spongiae]
MQRHDSAVTTALLADRAFPDARCVEESATLLRRAEAERTPIAPLTEIHEGLDLCAAYAVQTANVRHRIAAGDRIVGRKTGLTSLPMRHQLGVDEAVHAPLFQSMVIPDRGRIDSRELIAPRVESEIGLVLGRRVAGSRVTAADVAAAVTQVVLALEVIDSRIADWRVTSADAVADNACAARVVVGQVVDVTRSLLDGLRDECVGLYADGEQVAQGLGAEVLGDPLEAVAWLSRTLHAQGGAIQPGELLLTGSVHASVPLTAGSRFTVRSGTRHLPELNVTVR